MNATPTPVCFNLAIPLPTPPAPLQSLDAAEQATLAAPHGFRALDCDSVRHYVAARPPLQQRVGPPASVDSWTVREVGRRGGWALGRDGGRGGWGLAVHVENGVINS